MLAARWGHTQTVETLIRIRADVNAKDEVFCQLYIVMVLFIL